MEKERARIIPKIQMKAANVERKSRNPSRNIGGDRKCGKKEPKSFPESRWRPQMWKERSGILPELQVEAANVERKSRNHSLNTGGGHRCGKKEPKFFPNPDGDLKMGKIKLESFLKIKYGIAFISIRHNIFGIPHLLSQTAFLVAFHDSFQLLFIIENFSRV